MHPEQCAEVAPASAIRRTDQPVGYQIEAPNVAIRPLAEYDQLFGVEALS